MSEHLLGEHFDIHGGGQDLMFPHHENEIAQSEGAHGHVFVNYWLHNGFVRVDDEKMSKSLGNFFTVREVLAKFDAEVVRFFIVRAHYRSPLNYSDQHLDDARAGLDASVHRFARYAAAQADADRLAESVRRSLQGGDGRRLQHRRTRCAVLFDLATQVNRSHSAARSRLAEVAGGRAWFAPARSGGVPSATRSSRWCTNGGTALRRSRSRKGLRSA